MPTQVPAWGWRRSRRKLAAPFPTFPTFPPFLPFIPFIPFLPFIPFHPATSMLSRDLFARFDAAALRPPAPLGRPEDWQVPAAGEQDAWEALRRWCFTGTGIGASGRVTDTRRTILPFAVAVLSGGRAPATSRLVESLCHELDGSVQLAACSNGVDRLRLRLRVKLADVLPTRARRLTDPWDCGYATQTAEAIESLKRFSPRRATLIVAQALADDKVLACIDAMTRRQHTFRHPVRMLIITKEDVAESDGASSLRQRVELSGTPVTSITTDALSSK